MDNNGFWGNREVQLQGTPRGHVVQPAVWGRIILCKPSHNLNQCFSNVSSVTPFMAPSLHHGPSLLTHSSSIPMTPSTNAVTPFGIVTHHLETADLNCIIASSTLTLYRPNPYLVAGKAGEPRHRQSCFAASIILILWLGGTSGWGWGKLPGGGGEPPTGPGGTCTGHCLLGRARGTEGSLYWQYIIKAGSWLSAALPAAV